MQTFHGEPEKWADFFYIFKEHAVKHRWSQKKRRNRLMECMRDKAVSYITTLPSEINGDYKRPRKALKRRFGKIDQPKTLRRQLLNIKQNEEETVDQFADYSYRMVMDAYPEAVNSMIEKLAHECFLNGCRDKAAAYAAMEKNPKDKHKAVKAMKKSMCNLRSTGRLLYHTRQVTFEESANVRQIMLPYSNQKNEDNIHGKVSISKAIDALDIAKQIGESIAQQIQKLVSKN